MIKVIKDNIPTVDIIRVDELLIIDYITVHFGKNTKKWGHALRGNFLNGY